MASSHLPKLLHAFRRILSYPDEHLPQAVELVYVILQDELPEAAGDIAAFGDWLEQHAADGGGPWVMEEAFTRTFDVNPACALEVGWHLFGEEYARGSFLVRMRSELRRFQIPESVELPDHLSHVLAVVDAMPDVEAGRFVRACVAPAVDKMSRAVADEDSPYRFAVQALSRVLRHIWPGGDGEREATAFSSPAGADPLHAYPVADVAHEAELFPPRHDSPSSSSLPTLFQIEPPRGEEQ